MNTREARKILKNSKWFNRKHAGEKISAVRKIADDDRIGFAFESGNWCMIDEWGLENLRDRESEMEKKLEEMKAKRGIAIA